MCYKLAGLRIACHLSPEEKELVSNMELNMVHPKNILATLKWKRPQNISNIKKLHNFHAQNNKAISVPRTEIQQL